MIWYHVGLVLVLLLAWTLRVNPVVREVTRLMREEPRNWESRGDFNRSVFYQGCWTHVPSTLEVRVMHEFGPWCYYVVNGEVLRRVEAARIGHAIRKVVAERIVIASRAASLEEAHRIIAEEMDV